MKIPIATPLQVYRAATRPLKVVFNASDVLRRNRRRRKAKSDKKARYQGTRYEMAKQGRELCVTHGIDIEVIGIPPERPVLMASNHLSYLDPLVVAAHAPCVPIAKADVGNWPLIGPALKAMGVILVDRNNASSGASVVRDAVRALRAGTPVLIFAEGTTTNGETVLPFERGGFGIAKMGKVPVVPVRIDYEDPEMPWVGDATFVPHYLKMAATRSHKAYLNFGEPISPDDFDDVGELAEAARAAVEAMRYQG